LTDVDELYAVGGAQAVGALAYGTATIAPVDKIVGPGNVYVTEAKRQVFGTCGIDGLAGPSEVLVVADSAAKPEFVAGELVAQAEHDPLSRVAAVSRDRTLLESVAVLLDGAFGRASGRDDIVAHVLDQRTWLVHADTDQQILEVIERFAPEHLSLMVDDPYAWVPNIRHAGAIFVGNDTPVAAGDYLAGTNHTLPTRGAARFTGGLWVGKFLKTVTYQQITPAASAFIGAYGSRLSALEGFWGHKAQADLRVRRFTPSPSESERGEG